MHKELGVTDVSESLSGDFVDRYTIERELGRGGMATVYLARDLRHQRRVAIKVLRPGLVEGNERFLREIQVAAGLNHPHIVPLYDSGESGGRLYYVMPFVEGEALRSRLAREGAVPPAEVIVLGREVADALAYAHSRGVVHRDIKPENILLSSGHAVVADFGIARAIDAAGGGHLTEVGAAVGSPMYMSPEQVSGDANLDGRSDVYSLGCVLYEAVTGKPPFGGTTARGVMLRRLIETPPPLRTVRPDLPPDLEAVVAKAMAEEVGQRFASAVDCAAALSALERGTDPRVRLEPRQEKVSIAVLPFVNLSPDPDNAYFSDGMTDELANALAKIPGLRVAARTSAYSFRGQEQDVKRIGERLAVRNVLEGSVRKAGNRLRIMAQLVDTSDGYQLWSETYDRDLKDVFELQDEMARTIAGSLKVKLVGRQESALVEPATENLEAYTLCLRGQYHADRRTTEGFKTAIGYFEQAIALDPGYALAHSELGAAWAFRGFDEFADLSPLETMPRAKAAVQRAVELDPLLAQAHTRLGVLALLYEWDWARAERELLRAIALKPEYSFAYIWHGMLMATLGRFDESLQSIRRAQALDPLSITVNMVLPRCSFWARRLDDAERAARTVLEMDPRNQLAYVWSARVYAAMDRLSGALALLEKGRELTGTSPNLLGLLGMVYGRLERATEARATLEQLRGEGQRRWVSPCFEAYILAGLGDWDGVLQRLENASEQRSGFIPFLGVDPIFDPIADDPRFRGFLQRVGVERH